MKKILLIGKMNEAVRDVNSAISEHYSVQLCLPSTETVMEMLKVLEPDLILISLIGLYEIEQNIFIRISSDYPNIPVLTLGTENEKRGFSSFYKSGQFENLTRPIDNAKVLDAIRQKIGDSSSSEKEVSDIMAEVEAATEPQSTRKQILVVDDNAPTLRSIKAMLDDTYDVVLAKSGIKAMTAIGKKRPDLILLDYEMPVCDGKQTLEMIRGDEELKDIPVIFLTGVNDREHIEAVLSLKPAGYMLKPAVKDKLLEAIAKNLQQ